MSQPSQTTPTPTTPPALPRAWQPFTFGGVAAFARASYWRLLVVQVFVALLFAASAVWFLQHCYAPVLTRVIQKLPDGAALTNGHLIGLPSVVISETKFLSIALAADPGAEVDQSADVQITWRHDRLALSSLLSSALGEVEFKYGVQPDWDLSRTALEPLWEAWRPVLFVVTGVATTIALLAIWMAVAWLYAPAAMLTAWLGNRSLSWSGAWKLAGAALMPGAVLMAVGVVSYGSQIVDIFGLGWFGGVHFLVGFIYLLAAPLFMPAAAAGQSSPNPFTA